MFEKLRVVFTIPELRQKIFLTLMFLAIYRVGYQIPLPMIDQSRTSQASSGQGGGWDDLFQRAAVFSASQLRQATIFGLGIMPYISASIIFQLLGSVWKPIEELRKEGETGRKKINEYTRYLTVVLCLVQSTAYVWYYLMADGGQGGGCALHAMVAPAGMLPSRHDERPAQAGRRQSGLAPQQVHHRLSRSGSMLPADPLDVLRGHPPLWSRQRKALSAKAQRRLRIAGAG